MEASWTELLLDPAVASLIRTKARKLTRRAGRPRGDQEDAEQDLMLVLAKAAATFNPGRGEWAPFAAVVLSRGAANLRRREAAGRRRVDRSRLRTADPLGLEARPVDIDGRLDVQAVIAALDPKDRRLAELLQVLNIAEAARVLGVPRSTLYGQVRRLRKRLAAAGLDPRPAGPPRNRPSPCGGAGN